MKEDEAYVIRENSSNVRKDWSRFVDDVIHKVPKFVKRNERDVFMSINLNDLSVLMDGIRYNVNLEYDAESNEYIGTMEGFWFVESARTRDEVIQKLAERLQEFSVDYYKELEVYHNTADFKIQFPKVLKAIIAEDLKGIVDSFDVKYKGP